MVQFDKYGNLKPYKITILNLEDFAKIFTEIENTDHRKYLFNSYLDYTFDIINILKTPFFQLINGSFITQKRLPNDIDLVNFVPYQRSVEVKSVLEKLFHESKNKYFVDGYFGWLPQKDQENYEDAIENYNYWLNLYGNTRFDNYLKRSFPKGIIKINFE